MFLTENQFRDALHWYQKKIGSYDQQVWEKSIEERVLRGLSHAIPKKVARVKKESIDLDLDLIRGSYFAKAKPQQSWLTTTYLGIVRILLFPFYLNWWSEQTNTLICAILFILYCLQMISMYTYFNSDKDDFDEIPVSEVVSPLFMFFILGAMQSQIGASSSSKTRSFRSRLNCPPTTSTSSASTSKLFASFDGNETSNRVNNIFPSSSDQMTRESQQKSSIISNVNQQSNTIDLCKNCQERFDVLKEANGLSTTAPTLSSSKKLNPRRVTSKRVSLSSTSSSCHRSHKPVSSTEEKDRSSVSKDGTIPCQAVKSSKVSDDESGLDSMEIQETHTSKETETCLRQRKSCLNHNPGDTQEEEDSEDDDVENSDNSSTPGSPSTPSTSTTSSTKSTSGYSSRRKNLAHRKKMAACENVNLDEYDVKKEVNTDTEPDGTIGDLSSADECSPYSTIDSNNHFEWRRKYGIPRSSGIKIQALHRKDSSPVVFRKEKKSIESVISKGTSKSKSKSKSSKSSCLQFRLPTKKSRDCSSSAESECSMSPTSPITKLASDLDWPSINSDATSDDDDGGMIIGCDDDSSLRKLDEATDYFNFDTSRTSPVTVAASSSATTKTSLSSLKSSNRLADDRNPSVHFGEDSSYCKRSGKTLNDKVSCAIWQMRECQKVDLSVLDISSSIIRKVESVKHSNEYFYLGFILSLVLAFIPVIFKIRQFATSARFTESRRKVIKTPFSTNGSKEISEIIQEIPTLATDLLAETMIHSMSSWSVQFVVVVAILERFFLSLCFFFLLCVAERTFRERFLYAKYFCHLTSSRRARRSDLPHFRLNKVRNIKTWLSVRSYLQNHGPQRSIDAIISFSFIVEVSILTFLCIQLLRDNEICSEKLYCWEMVFWNLAIGLYIMRLIILGSKMNRKNRGCLTILLSEQINLYLQLEQKPHKKEDLTLANQLIKSAADVLKLLEAPFKISGFSANPYLYNITKVIVLSAFSAVLTELLGFKLKLYKIKLTT